MSDVATIILLLVIAVFSIAVNAAFCLLYFRFQNQRDQKRLRNERRAAVRLKTETEANVLRMLSEARTQFFEATESVERKVDSELQRQDDRLESVAKVVYEMQHPDQGERTQNRISYLSKAERDKRYIKKHGLDETKVKVG